MIQLGLGLVRRLFMVLVWCVGDWFFGSWAWCVSRSVVSPLSIGSVREDEVLLQLEADPSRQRRFFRRTRA